MVLDFLNWLHQNNKLYANIKIEVSNLDEYDDDGMIPDLNEHIIHNIVEDAPAVFNAESAGIGHHPAHELNADKSADDPNDPNIFLESNGIFDANNTDIPAQSLLSSTLHNLNPNLKDSMPDIAIH